MKTSGSKAKGSHIGLNGQKPALQVICLGSSGGPSEQNATAFLVRSVGSAWAKGSLLAVDAGSHFAPIQRILEQDFPTVSADRRRRPISLRKRPSSRSTLLQPALSRMSMSPSPSTEDEEPPKPEPTTIQSGPFSGLTLPNESARANALHVLRTYVSTYLITHPHLDHIAGFAINTAGFHATSRPKTLAALPSTVDAMKRHIFNDVIWPNLTDEDGGVGFVTFQRLKEGGDVMLGEGEGRGYIDVCDGLGVRAFKVSHGVCSKSPPSHQHRGSLSGGLDPQMMYNGPMYNVSQDPGSTPQARTRSISGQTHFSAPGTPGFSQRQNYFSNQPSPQLSQSDNICVVDSTAFFIRDGDTQREVLIFGDVEPDSLSLSPRNHVVWQEAARKIAYSLLGAVFIECSYADSQPDAVLFGHLCPRHLIAELHTLAVLVHEARHARLLDRAAARKRKRSNINGPERQHTPIDGDLHKRRSAGASASVTASVEPAPDSPRSPRSTGFPQPTAISATSAPAGSSPAVPGVAAAYGDLPLQGLKVVVIHVKDTLKDGPYVGETILEQLCEHEQRLREAGQGLGCEFVISASGESYHF